MGTPPLVQLVRDVRRAADPLLARLSDDPAAMGPFLAALAALERAVEREAGDGDPAPAADPAGLADQAAKLRQALRDAPLGICMLEGPEYRYTFTNPSYEQAVGRTQVVGKPLRSVFPELDGQDIYSRLDGVMASGMPFVAPEILVQLDRDGDGVAEDIYYAVTYAPLRDAAGQVIGVIDYVQDMTDRRALEQERVRVLQLTRAAQDTAEAERQRLFGVLYQAPAAICVLDGPSHVITFANPHYGRLVGRTDLVGKPVRAALPEVEGQGFFELLDAVYATGVPFSGTEVSVQLQRDGKTEQAVVNFIYAPLRDATETIRGLFVHAVEVTELVQARQEAEAAVVMRDQFLSIAAHELRTPITTLFGYVQVLQRRLRRNAAADPRTDRTLTVMEAQARRLIRLIDTLMDVTRIHMGSLNLEREVLDLGALVREVLEEIQVIAAQRTVHMALPPTPCLVLGDRLRLEQVVVNLVHNALKYSPGGEAIAIEVGETATEVWAQVRDQGLGIPAAELPALFTRFYRGAAGTARVIPGMGLGLAVVAEIVALHDGRITVDSTEGVGSTFTVTLPRAAGPAAA